MSGKVERGTGDLVVRAVTAIMAAVVGLTFLFGFGSVLSLGLRLGVPVWVAPLVAPAVDLSILDLLLGIRHLAFAGALPEVLRPARRLLMFASRVTLALNVADPVITGQYGKAAFDSVGPLLLIGWAEVGPVLQAIGSTVSPKTVLDHRVVDVAQDIEQAKDPVESGSVKDLSTRCRAGARGRSSEQLLDEARREDAAHRAELQKPISAEALRVRLAIGSASARWLVKIVPAEVQAHQVLEPGTGASRQSETVDPILVA